MDGSGEARRGSKGICSLTPLYFVFFFFFLYSCGAWDPLQCFLCIASEGEKKKRKAHTMLQAWLGGSKVFSSLMKERERERERVLAKKKKKYKKTNPQLRSLEQAPIFALPTLPDPPSFSPHSYRVEDQHELEGNRNRSKNKAQKNMPHGKTQNRMGWLRVCMFALC